MVTVKPETGSAEADVATKPKRIVSTIDFPYSDLDSAVELARTIHNRAGMSCETEQLAGWMDQSSNSGTFRSRTAAAKMFGLTVSERGSIGLSSLGLEVLDPSQERAARVTAFLNVPLYLAMYEQYKGYALPPSAAIQRQMVTLGVSEKQAERARQVFQKSAAQANFLDPGSGRFIKPSVGPSEAPPSPEKKKTTDDNGTGNGPLHPFIQGLLNELPGAGKIAGVEWPDAKRKLWLSTAESIFKMIYKDSANEVARTLPSEPTAPLAETKK